VNPDYTSPTFDAAGRVNFFQPTREGERENRMGAAPDQAPAQCVEHVSSPADLSKRKPRFEHIAAGAERLHLVIAARQMRRQKIGWREIYRRLNANSSLLRWVLSVAHIVHDDHITAEHLADRTYKIPGRARALQLLPAETEAIRANKLLNNLNADAGSTPRAIFQTIKEGKIRPEVAAHFLEREAAGKPLVTPAIANDLHISPVNTRDFRNPRNAWLEFNQSPGSLQVTRDEITGELRPVEPGEFCTIDDGTKNFICTVPMQRPGDKCYENFGVVVGRWQILLLVDHRTYFIMGFSHTARPKGSYRAEDMQATFHLGFQQHGLPKKVILENGISRAEVLHQTFDKLGVKYEHGNSPHQKVVECVFNNLWSRLSFLPGQVGRVRGEEDKIDAIVESCKRGATDPRNYFLPLKVVLEALREAIADWNSHRINSPQYGSWVPAEWFAAAAPRVLRPLDPASRWIFSPTIATNNGNGYLVRKQHVTLSVPVMPGYSWQFDYEVPDFQDWYGARVNFHFNAFEPESTAKAVLAQSFHGFAAGHVIGDAIQCNLNTRLSRRLLGIDELEDVGLLHARRSAQALHRSTVAIRPDGKPGVQTHEARDGVGNTSKLQHHGNTPAAPLPPLPDPVPRRLTLPAPTAAEVLTRRNNLNRKAELAKRLMVLADCQTT